MCQNILGLNSRWTAVAFVGCDKIARSDRNYSHGVFTDFCWISQKWNLIYVVLNSAIILLNRISFYVRVLINQLTIGVSSDSTAKVPPEIEDAPSIGKSWTLRVEFRASLVCHMDPSRPTTVQVDSNLARRASVQWVTHTHVTHSPVQGQLSTAVATTTDPRDLPKQVRQGRHKLYQLWYRPAATMPCCVKESEVRPAVTPGRERYDAIYRLRAAVTPQTPGRKSWRDRTQVRKYLCF